MSGAPVEEVFADRGRLYGILIEGRASQASASSRTVNNFSAAAVSGSARGVYFPDLRPLVLFHY